MASKPTIIPRSAWGGRGSRSGTIPPANRRYYVVHWPVMSARDERAWMRDIETMHINQGWGMIGYSYGIGPSGTIYEGCGLNTRPIHSPMHNSDAWGVVHLQASTASGVPTAPITDAMKQSSVALYEWLGTQAGRTLTKWWHGRDYATACPGPDLRAWVAAGMPAGAPAPAPTPTPKLPEGNMTTSEVAANGTLHVWSVGPQRKTVWLTTQRKGQAAWSGGQANKQIAKLVRWANAPEGRTFVGISACRSEGGVLNFFATLDDGRVMDRWQRPNETAWNPPVGLREFAPKP